MNTNLVKLDKELALSQQDNTVTEITKQVDNVMGALQKFEEETEAKAIKNAENLEVDAIGVDLLPEAGKEFMYTEFNRIGEELAEAENRKDRKAVRELKLEGANLIKAQNTIGQMLKDHAEDLLGVDGEGSYSGGSDATMMNMLINKEYTIRKEGKDMVIDFTGPNGKKGIKLEDLDEHIYLKKNDLAVNYDKEINSIRNNAYKGLPFEKDRLSKVVKQTLNTTQKLVASMWDDNFTLKGGQTLKELWEEENPGLDANQYLRTSGGNWNEKTIRDFANKKLMQGGINDSISYKKKDSGSGGFYMIGKQSVPKSAVDPTVALLNGDKDFGPETAWNGVIFKRVNGQDFILEQVEEEGKLKGIYKKIRRDSLAAQIQVMSSMYGYKSVGNQNGGDDNEENNDFNNSNNDNFTLPLNLVTDEVNDDLFAKFEEIAPGFTFEKNPYNDNGSKRTSDEHDHYIITAPLKKGQTKAGTMKIHLDRSRQKESTRKKLEKFINNHMIK